AVPRASLPLRRKSADFMGRFARHERGNTAAAKSTIITAVGQIVAKNGSYPHTASRGVGGFVDADQADIPGATLAERAMEPRAQLAQGRGRQRAGSSGDGVRTAAA